MKSISEIKMNNKNGLLRTAIKETDFVLLLLSIFTSIYGIIMVISATNIDVEDNQLISRDARTMILAVILGVIIAISISFVDYNFLNKLYPFIGAFCILIMLILFIPGVGVGPEERPDAKTWIAITGTGLFFQPSELVKVGFVITFGMHLELVQDKLNKLKHILFLCIHGAIPVALVIVTGDLGSALVFMLIFVVMMFCAGVQLRYFIIGIAAITAGIPVFWYFIISDIQRDRILALFYPDLYENLLYQQNRGLEAIQGGGLTGQGLFNGSYTQSGIVPESENDMIFTCIGEELGFIGCIAALLMLLVLVIRIMNTGKKSKKTATSLMCYGIASMIASQVIINIGMCLKILPVVGITLPFFSAGGSSNVCIYIAIGLILSIYRYDKEKEVVNFRLSNITPFANS